MAEKNTPAGGADFVAKIVKDPKNPPATLMLTGFLGASSEDKHTRLYFDPHLSNYAEIPNDAILYRQDAASEDGLGATHVWIQRDAQLTYGPAASQRPKGAFLDGPIMQDHLAGAAAAAPGVAFPVTMMPACGVTQHPLVCGATMLCPPSVRPCISQPIICNVPLRTLSPPCLPITVGPPCLVSAQFGCPTIGVCPSIACTPAGGTIVEQPQMRMAAPAAPGAGAGAPAAAFTFVLAACRTSFVDPACGGGGLHTMEMALPTLWAYCTQVCHPGGGGGTPVMALPTLGAFCTQVCGPSFLGIGCGPGGGTLVGIQSAFAHNCSHVCSAHNCGPGGGTIMMAMQSAFAHNCSHVCSAHNCGPGGTHNCTQ
jgi:hypothetical protein